MMISSFLSRGAILMSVAILVGGVGVSAQATTLLDLEDPAGQTFTPFDLPFIAGSSSTTVTFEGYQVLGSELLNQIGVFLNGMDPNLLGPSWVFTPAPSGSDASTFVDQTSVPGLRFAGLVEDSFDMFSQTIATTVGSLYTIDFLSQTATLFKPAS